MSALCWDEVTCAQWEALLCECTTTSSSSFASPSSSAPKPGNPAADRGKPAGSGEPNGDA